MGGEGEGKGRERGGKGEGKGRVEGEGSGVWGRGGVEFPTVRQCPTDLSRST